MKKAPILFVLLCLSFAAATAQFKVLLNFDSANGANPWGSLIRSGKSLFGMTQMGGEYNAGRIFSIDTDGSLYKNLLDFDDANGNGPYGDLLLVGSKLYGMTSGGGIYNDGCVFKLDTNGSNYIDLFDFDLADGLWPHGNLILSGAFLYGLTTWGGIHDSGCLFKIDTNGSGFLNIHNFSYSTGILPYGSLTLSKGLLYGITSIGGAYKGGCIFSIDTAGNGYRDLHDFIDSNSNSYGSLIIYGKKLYGMCQGGGLFDCGYVFSMDTSGSGFFHVLDLYYNTTGGIPEGSLLINNGILYGTTQLSPMRYGNVFSIDTDGNNYKDMFEFNGTDGTELFGNLILSGSQLYGMAYAGGTNNKGVIFRLDTSNSITSVNTLNLNLGDINIYPNPNNGIFNVLVCQFERISEPNLTIEIYNILGEKILIKPLRSTSGANLINLSDQSSGIYLYRVENQNGTLMSEGKIVIDK